MEKQMINFIRLEAVPLILAFLGNALFDEVALKFVFTVLGIVVGHLIVRLINKKI
jgi:hypothetical protein